MAVYGHVRPARGSGRRQGLLLSFLSAAVSVSWAFTAMAGVAALGAHLLGLDRYASLPALTAALVAMGVGGSVSPSGDLSVFGLGAAGAQGAVGIMPLGVSFVGAVVLGLLFVRPLYRLPVLAPSVLATRAAGALAGFLVLLGVVAWAGNGTVAIKLDSLVGGGSGSGGGSGGGLLGGLGGLGGLISGAVGDSASPTVGFKVDLPTTLGLGALWLLAVLLLALLAARRVPLPRGWGDLGRTVRPAVSAVVTVLLAAVLAGAVSGIVVGLSGNGGAKTVGGVLLGTPNGVSLAVPLGMAVPLTGKADGPLTQFLPSPVNLLLKDGDGRSITLGRLAQLDGRVWLLPVAVALLLLAAGVFTAVRTPRPVRPQGALREAGAVGLRLGLALAVTVPLLLALGAVSVDANLSVFGFSAVGAGLSVSGSLAAGAGLGLVEGVVFGILGALLVRRFADGKRPSRTLRPTAAPATTTAPAATASAARAQDGPGGASRTGGADPGYGALPTPPPPPVGTGPSANPYAAPVTPPVAPPPPPVNPYSGGPTREPPPPPLPPGR